jgi:hypothetical protein
MTSSSGTRLLQIYLGNHQVDLCQRQSSKFGKSGISTGFIWKIALVHEDQAPN